MAGKKVTRCTVKTGQHTGATYYVHTRMDWGTPHFSIDVENTGWHNSTKAARISAEANGWVYVTNQAGERTMVHQSAAKYYA